MTSKWLLIKVALLLNSESFFVFEADTIIWLFVSKKMRECNWLGFFPVDIFKTLWPVEDFLVAGRIHIKIN